MVGTGWGNSWSTQNKFLSLDRRQTAMMMGSFPGDRANQGLWMIYHSIVGARWVQWWILRIVSPLTKEGKQTWSWSLRHRRELIDGFPTIYNIIVGAGWLHVGARWVQWWILRIVCPLTKEGKQVSTRGLQHWIELIKGFPTIYNTIVGAGWQKVGANGCDKDWLPRLQGGTLSLS